MKILSSFAGFTADQWKSWTLVFSPIVLKGILPAAHLCCWLAFVNACKILCSPQISFEDIETADSYLVLFLHMFKSLYGAVHMHLHLHLKNCLLAMALFMPFGALLLRGIMGYLVDIKQIIKQWKHSSCTIFSWSRKLVQLTYLLSLNHAGTTHVIQKLLNSKGQRVSNCFKGKKKISDLKKSNADILNRRVPKN